MIAAEAVRILLQDITALDLRRTEDDTSPERRKARRQTDGVGGPGKKKQKGRGIKDHSVLVYNNSLNRMVGDLPASMVGDSIPRHLHLRRKRNQLKVADPPSDTNAKRVRNLNKKVSFCWRQRVPADDIGICANS